MPFTPKFVDLVRNLTSVQGTGPVTLGAAVTGYTSLAAAATPGEQFYYCIQGVDKPAEREVGRGTMQAGGTIAREAVSGSLTNFSAGTKTIALVAAAEWFSRLNEMGPSAPFDIDTRTNLAATNLTGVRPAFLAERGREGLFVFDSANLSAKVTADPSQGIYIAPAAAPSGATGAWVRRFDGAVNVRWFGATGDGVTNDGAAFTAALALLKVLATTGYGYSIGSPRLFVPAGVYFLGATTIDIVHTLIIEGESSGEAGGGASVLMWSAGATGIRVQRFNTSGGTAVDTVTHSGGDASIIRGLFLKGGFTNFASEGEFHGIHLRARASVRDCYISGFQGDGIRVFATAGYGAGGEGNANCANIERVLVSACRNGIFLDGADVNACTIIGADVSDNRQWGIWDSSFLGNSYYGCHASGNGLAAAGSPPSLTAHGGNVYYVKIGQEAGASTNAPTGTTASNSWWGHSGPGGAAPPTIPAWASGTVYRAGGPYAADNSNAANLFSGCYSEGGQGPSQFVSPTLVIGGLHGAGVAGGAVLTSIGNAPSSPVGFIKNFGDPISGATVRYGIGENGVPATINYASHSAYAPNAFRTSFGHSGGTFLPQDLWTNYDNAVDIERITGPSTGEQFGSGAAQPYYRHVTKFALGAYGSARRMDYAAAAPTTGAHGPGEIVFNNARAGGAPVGWQCTAAGTPGTWAAFYGPTSNADAIGYASGAGGAITQATSKATGVTLNKASGQVTMNGAALAAAASVSFTLTNSAIAASDVVIVSIGAGASAASYSVGVDAVAAGSCRVQLRNVSAGSLSEAPVLNFAVIKAVAA